MKFASLHDLYVNELKDLYNAENQFVAMMPRMAEAATAPELQTAFSDRTELAKVQVERLESICEELGISPKGKKCKAMEGLITEGKEQIGAADSGVLDAVMIATAQRADHYAMAAYGCLRSYAEKLGFEESALLLQETLLEKSAADKRLSEIAELAVNVVGVSGDEEEIQLVPM